MASKKGHKEDLPRLLADVGTLLAGEGSSLNSGGTAGTAGGLRGDAICVEKLRGVLPRLLEGFLDPLRGARRCERSSLSRQPLTAPPRVQSSSKTAAT